VEEAIFRVIFCTLLERNGSKSFWGIVISQALFFSLAHAHFVFLRFVQHKKGSIRALNIKETIAETLFQMGFTFIFGIYSGYFYMRTKSLIAVFTLHSFCNFIGIPRFDLIA